MTMKERIKQLCDMNGITSQILEKDCGLGAGFISKIDKSSPSAANLLKVAKRLGVSLDYLMGEELNIEPLNDNKIREMALVQNFGRLNRNDQRVIMSMITVMLDSDHYKKGDNDAGN